MIAVAAGNDKRHRKFGPCHTPEERAERMAEHEALRGPWQDVGEGRCQQCGAERRLYSPLARPKLRVCAPCTEPMALRAIPKDYSRRGDDESDEPMLELPPVPEFDPDIVAGGDEDDEDDL